MSKSTRQRSALQRKALALHKIGLSPIFLKPESKLPDYPRSWGNFRYSEAQLIEECETRDPDSNLGILLGAINGNGDKHGAIIDIEHDRLEPEGDDAPETIEQLNESTSKRLHKLCTSTYIPAEYTNPIDRGSRLGVHPLITKGRRGNHHIFRLSPEFVQSLPQDCPSVIKLPNGTEIRLGDVRSGKKATQSMVFGHCDGHARQELEGYGAEDIGEIPTAHEEVEKFILKAIRRQKKPKVKRTRRKRPTNTPLDFYVETHGGIDQLVEDLGYKVTHARDGVTYFTRPGKENGVSASIGHVTDQYGAPAFYAFSTNCGCFEEGRVYNAHAVAVAHFHEGEVDLNDTDAYKAVAKHVHESDEYGVRPLSNATIEHYLDEDGHPKTKVVGRPLADIVGDVDDINSRHGSKMICVGGPGNLKLVRDGSVEPRPIKGTSSFIAAIQGMTQTEFYSGPTVPTKEEIYHGYCQGSASDTVYDGIRKVVYFGVDDPDTRIFTTVNADDYPPDDRMRAADEFVSMFNPTNEIEREALWAMFCTPLWNAPGGSYPFFAVTARDGSGQPGDGKSKTVEKLLWPIDSKPCIVDMDSTTDVDQIRKRMFSGQPAEIVVLLDNMNHFINHRTLNAWITSGRIDGYENYYGRVTVKNNYLFVGTVNRPSFGHDLADRSVILSIEPPTDPNPNWERDIEKFVARNRHELFCNARAFIEREPEPDRVKGDGSRMHAWKHNILSKCDHAAELLELFAKRRRAADTQSEEASVIRDRIVDKIKEANRDKYSDFESRTWFIPTSVLLATLIDYDASVTAKSFSKRYVNTSLPEIQRTGYRPRINGVRQSGYFWVPVGAPVPESAPIVDICVPVSM